MSKWAPDAMLEAGLNYVRSNCDRMVLCSAQPTTYNEAMVTYALATATMTVDNDYTLADGTVSGRKITTAVKADVSVTATGTGTHIAFCKTGDTSLRYVTTCTNKAVSSGTTMTIPAISIELADPA